MKAVKGDRDRQSPGSRRGGLWARHPAGMVAGLVCVAFVTGATAFPGSAAEAAPPAVGSGASVAQHRAEASYWALQRNFYVGGTSLYLGSPSNTCGTYSCLWPFSNADAGTAFLSGAPAGARFLAATTARQAGLRHYFDVHEVSPGGSPQPPAYESAVKPPLGPGGSTYYDDNAWVGLNLVHAYQLTSDTTYLTMAQDEIDFAVTGWDTSTTDGCPGGIYWEDVAGSQRNTTASGANAELALELASLTGDPSDLAWATRIYGWVRTCLLQSSDLYGDHVNPNGTLNTTIWSYNQGVMIGAGVLLYRATGDSTYLEEAEQTASAAVAYFGTGSTLLNQGPAFDAIYFRSLLFLGGVAPDSAYTAEARSFAQSMWSQRQTTTGLIDPQYGVNGTAPMVEIFSLLAGSAPVP